MTEHARAVGLCTDPGLVRVHNEDAIFADANLGIAILADGMGGYQAGEVASGMACTLLADSFVQLLPRCDAAFLAAAGGPAQLLADEIRAVNAAIFNASATEPRYAGMGTTLVVAWYFADRLYVAHVGDSRLYRLRGRQFQQLTRDHSLLQEQLDSGMITAEEARYSADRNLVTRALGIESEVLPEVHEYDVQPGEVVLLCSDGLTDMLADEQIAATLKAGQEDLQHTAGELVEQANDAGGRDNISVILLRAPQGQGTTGGWWRKLLANLK